MIAMRFDTIAACVGGTLDNSAGSQKSCQGVSIDSRTLNRGELFVAIRGERMDGHDFISEALKRGASGIIADRAWPRAKYIAGDVVVITVEDTHEALKVLARAWLAEISPRVIGITGSNGKTTTKEYTVALAKSVEPYTYGSPGNLNNLYGIPLAILRMPKETKVAVLEMGISTPGEMDKLTNVVKPDVAVITNVGATHLEFLGSISGVAHEKTRLIVNAKPNAAAVVCADDAMLMSVAMGLDRPLTTFGFSKGAVITTSSEEAIEGGRSRVVINDHPFVLTISGRHQLYNLLAAYAAVTSLGFDFSSVRTETIVLTTAPLRGQTLERGGIRIIADCYNANPDSVHAALEAFDDAAQGRHIVILGDMLELGVHAVDYHRELGTVLARRQFDLILLVGPLTTHTREAAIEQGLAAHRIQHFSTAAQCADQVRSLVIAGDAVLVKGSRGIGLEKVLDVFNGTAEGEKVAR